MCADRELRQTAIGVFKLLREFAQMRRKPVLDIGEYEDHLWLHEVPTAKDTFNRMYDDEREIDPDVWVEVQRKDEPLCPSPPAICRPWLQSQLPFDDEEPPLLLDRIPVKRDLEPEAEQGEDFQPIEWTPISDHPEALETWERYVREMWTPWAEVHPLWRAHQRRYSILFGMRQALKRAGEQLELIVGFGLLETLTGEGKQVRRHVLTLQAALDFSLEDGTISVRAPLEGLRPALETDMLPVEQRPPEEVTSFFEQQASKSLEADPWAQDVAHKPLRVFVNSYPQAVYSADTRPPEKRGQAFVVTFAPALILRKRSMRGMLASFNEVIRQLEADGEVPPSIRVIAGDQSRAETGAAGGDRSARTVPERVFFPKPTNQEQLEIVHRLGSADGLLVQGPPGTGKSHTIANLISHILATGGRVLVTAETPRALRVLADKIPAEIKALCVCLLGNDRESQAGLEASVRGISERLATWNRTSSRMEIDRCEQVHAVLQGRREKIDARLRSLREAETQPHEIAEGAYRGTAQAIAEQVAHEKLSHGWFEDEVDPMEQPPLSGEEFAELVRLVRTFDHERLRELELALPDPTHILPSTQELLGLFEQERKAASDLAEFDTDPPAPQLFALDQASIEQVQRLAISLEEVHRSFETARRRPLPWVATALHEVLAGDDTPWRTLRDLTSSRLEGLAAAAERADQRRIQMPSGADPTKVQADATDVLRALDAGKTVNFLSKFVDPQLRKGRYLFSRVLVDGRPCSTVEPLGALVEALGVRRTLEDIWRQWADHITEKPSTLTMQVSRLEENVEALDLVLDMHRALDRAREQIRQIGGLPEPGWHDTAEREAVRRRCGKRLAARNHRRAEARIQEIEARIAAFMSTSHSHPVIKNLLTAVRNRDDDSVVKLRLELSDLCEAQRRVYRRRELLDQLESTAPRVMAAFLNAPEDPAWSERAGGFETACRWSQARAWLRAAREDGGFNELNDRHIRLRAESEEALQSLAGAHAWHAALNRMTENHRQHLIGWQQVMKRGGKFTGKHAATHREQAKHELELCKEAIPAWVMPLFQLHETVRPQPGMFDVVIVDEASQCGLDALLLMYIGKKMIIVGDDEQISPTSVGVKQDEFKALVDHFLPGFENASAFHPDTSLFDLGSRWFPDRIVLREHFRCMPEIIRFSNDLCYRATPLIPLRQYPPDRLQPVVARYVDSGAQRGKSSYAINDAEARALVEVLVDCCRKPEYAGKEMGVISLLGDAQAKRIESMLLGRLRPEEIEKRRLVCGDAYSFQGDERDVMFLSMVNSPVDESGLNIRSLARTRALFKQRYNVAASRARDQLWLFHSLTLDDLPNPEDLRRTLLDFCLHGGTQTNGPGDLDVDEIRRRAFSRTRADERPRPFDSWFEVDVFLKIHDRGYRVIPQFEFAGYLIDLVIEYGARRLAVECDGDHWHGPEQFLKDLDRQRQLERAGWTFWRVRGSEFYADPATALEGLWLALDSLGIRSRNYRPEPPPEPPAITPLGPSEAEAQDRRGLVRPVLEPEPPAEAGDSDERMATNVRPSTSTKPPTRAPDFGAEPSQGMGDEERGPTGGGESSDDEERGAVVTELATRLSAVPYPVYSGRALPDPRTGKARAVQDGLVEIVGTEGPILHERLVRVYAHRAGFQRAGPVIKAALKRQVDAAVRQLRLIREHDSVDRAREVPVYRRPSQEPGPIRTAGERSLCEIPPREVAAVMKAILDDRRGRSASDLKWLCRQVLEFYGFKRLTAGVERYLVTVFEKYLVRR